MFSLHLPLISELMHGLLGVPYAVQRMLGSVPAAWSPISLDTLAKVFESSSFVRWVEGIGILNVKQNTPHLHGGKSRSIMNLVCNIQSKFQTASEVESNVLWRMEESFEASFIKPWYSGDDDEPAGLVLQGPRSQHAAVCRPQLPPCLMFCLAPEAVFCSFVHGRILLCSLLVSYQGSLQAFGAWLACQDLPVSLCLSVSFLSRPASS